MVLLDEMHQLQMDRFYFYCPLNKFDFLVLKTRLVTEMNLYLDNLPFRILIAQYKWV